MNSSLSEHVKSTFKFNEVTSMTGVKPYVLRFWESEFDQINPRVNEIGQKIYAPMDIEAVERVKKLLFEDKLSIPQAKGYLDRQAVEESFDFDVHSDVENEVNHKVKLNDDIGESHLGECLFHEEKTLKSRSLDLKKALEQIIEKNSAPKTVNETLQDQSLEVEDSAEVDCYLPVIDIDTVKEEIVNQRHLLDKDVVNLVSAKKKLSVLTARIDEICLRNNWH